jgi:hypothetical protein
MEKLVQSLGQILVTQGRNVGSVEEQGKKALARMNKQFTAKPLPPLGTKKQYQDQLVKIAQRRVGLQTQLAKIDHYLRIHHQSFSMAPLVYRGPISAEITQAVAKKQNLQQQLHHVKSLQEQCRKIIKQHGIQMTDLSKVLDQLQEQDSAESSSDLTASSNTLP